MQCAWDDGMNGTITRVAKKWHKVRHKRQQIDIDIIIIIGIVISGLVVFFRLHRFEWREWDRETNGEWINLEFVSKFLLLVMRFSWKREASIEFATNRLGD